MHTRTTVRGISTTKKYPKVLVVRPGGIVLCGTCTGLLPGTGGGAGLCRSRLTDANRKNTPYRMYRSHTEQHNNLLLFCASVREVQSMRPQGISGSSPHSRVTEEGRYRLREPQSSVTSVREP